METKFTKGPWKVFTTKDGRALLGVGDRRGGGITDCGDVSTNDLGIWRDGSEKWANAHLIASSPDLYEALEAILPLFEDAWNEWKGSAHHVRVRAALAKARGEKA